jgi:hypothetical protein
MNPELFILAAVDKPPPEFPTIVVFVGFLLAAGLVAVWLKFDK